MLPAAARLRRRSDFRETTRRGRRAARPALTIAILGSDAVAETTPRVGFVVGRRTGGAVVRNRLRRRLRHLLADRLDRLPRGSRVVVRALPGAEQLSAAQLRREVDLLVQRGTR